MPVPTSDIAIVDIAAQLIPDQLIPDPTDLSLYGLYDHASTTSGINGGSSGYAGNFHNLAMGVSSPDYFANKIWSKWNGGSNLPVGNWGNYNYDANVVLDWDISMAANFKPADLFACDIYLTDAYNGGAGGNNYLVANISLGAGQSSVEVDFDTQIPAFSTFQTTGYQTTGYYIYVVLSSNITGSNCIVRGITGGFGDTDGVGPDTTRTIYGGQINVGMSNTFNGIIVSGSTQSAQIAYNKRTYFTLEVKPS